MACCLIKCERPLPVLLIGYLTVSELIDSSLGWLVRYLELNWYLGIGFIFQLNVFSYLCVTRYLSSKWEANGYEFSVTWTSGFSARHQQLKLRADVVVSWPCITLNLYHSTLLICEEHGQTSVIDSYFHIFLNIWNLNSLIKPVRLTNSERFETCFRFHIIMDI